MIFQNGERIVFTGDSVTDMDRARPVGEGLFDNLGRSYVRVVENLLMTCYPELKLRISNTGCSGNTSRDLLHRFGTDVLDLQPDWVSICIGINDVWRQFDSPAMPDQHVLPEEYRANLEKMLTSLQGRVKGVFLLTPYYIEPSTADPMRARMDEYVAICRELAEQYGCVFVDFQGTFEKYCRHHHSSFVAWDRVHPNQIGATILAREFLRHCGFDFAHVPQE